MKKRVTVKRLYKGGQKPDGWFGCFASERGNSRDIPMTGVCRDEVREGSVLDVEGEWQSRNGYESFVCTDVQLVTDTMRGIISYFSGKRFPGIGSALAKRLYDAYGKDVFAVIAENPDRVKRELGVGEDQMQTLISGVQQKTVDNLLQKWLPMLTDVQARRLKRDLGDNAADVIMKYPYRLIDSGIPFQTADGIAMQVLELPRNDTRRIEEGTLYVLKKHTGGDMYLDLSDNTVYHKLHMAVMRLLNLSMTPEQYADSLQAACGCEGSKIVMKQENGGRTHLYERELYQAEMTITRYIDKSRVHVHRSGIDTLIRDYESVFGISFADEQKKAVVTAVTNRVSCITGGPGRGKTSVISCLASIAAPSTMLLAPTGKAAKRLSAVTGREAMTIARFLLLSQSRGKEFSQYGHYIVDEASMVSSYDMANLMGLLTKSAAGLTLVGDVDQLHPVDAGSPFHDIIRSGVLPVAYLSVNHRTEARSIVDNADRIHDGDTALKTGLSPDGEIEFLTVPQKADDAAAVQYIVDLYKDSLRKKNISDVAVICPMNKGLFGVRALNLRLQDELNKEHKGVVRTGHHYTNTTCPYIVSDRGAAVPGMLYRQDGENWTNFRIGDRVMQTANHADMPWMTTDTDVSNPRFDMSLPVCKTGEGIYNGDCGTILDFTAADEENPMYVTIGMDDGRVFRIPDDMLSELTMAYAMTVHKSQGCEYDTVIYASPHALLGLKGFACRNLVYTAVTRAKSSVQIVGSKESLDRCILTPAPERKSLLRYRLQATAVNHAAAVNRI